MHGKGPMKTGWTVLLLAALLPPLVASCKAKPALQDVLPVGSVCAIKFCEMATGDQKGLEVRVVRVVTNSAEIAIIIKGVAVGREVPVTKAIYRRIIVIEQSGTNEDVSVSYFEPYHEQAGIKQGTLRIGAREHETTQDSIRLLSGYYTQRISSATSTNGSNHTVSAEAETLANAVAGLKAATAQDRMDAVCQLGALGTAESTRIAVKPVQGGDKAPNP